MSAPAFLGSLLGALSASRIPTSSMRPLIFFLLIFLLLYTWRHPQLGEIEAFKHHERKRKQIVAGAGLVLGFYDGLFGPGTGTFLMLVLASLGFTFLSASAISKIVNVVTNLGAVIVFGFHSAILWKIAIVLSAANILGGTIGASLAIRGGSALIRKVFLLATLALIAKVGVDTFTSW
jgi:uncharacterized membrane protein YfcA